jgi:transcription antitermination protein NusB
MATPRDIRRLAFLALFQLDVSGEIELDAVRASVEHSASELKTKFSPREVDRAVEFARGAFGERRAADRAISELAPSWPAHRQPAVDRALLRLAHFEMTGGRTPPKVAVAEAIRLAKDYSTDRSPAFVNGVLDKVLKRLGATPAEAPDTTGTPSDAGGS